MREKKHWSRVKDESKQSVGIKIVLRRKLWPVRRSEHVQSFREVDQAHCTKHKLTKRTRMMSEC